MDPVIIETVLKLGLGGVVIWWLATELKAMGAKADAKAAEFQALAKDMQTRCDSERRELGAEIAKVRDAHAKDQREVLLAATNALADVARTNRELVTIHERREGSGVHPTKQG